MLPEVTEGGLRCVSYRSQRVSVLLDILAPELMTLSSSSPSSAEPSCCKLDAQPRPKLRHTSPREIFTQSVPRQRSKRRNHSSLSESLPSVVKCQEPNVQFATTAVCLLLGDVALARGRSHRNSCKTLRTLERGRRASPHRACFFFFLGCLRMPPRLFVEGAAHQKALHVADAPRRLTLILIRVWWHTIQVQKKGFDLRTRGQTRPLLASQGRPPGGDGCDHFCSRYGLVAFCRVC